MLSLILKMIDSFEEWRTWRRNRIEQLEASLWRMRSSEARRKATVVAVLVRERRRNVLAIIDRCDTGTRAHLIDALSTDFPSIIVEAI